MNISELHERLTRMIVYGDGNMPVGYFNDMEEFVEITHVDYNQINKISYSETEVNSVLAVVELFSE